MRKIAVFASGEGSNAENIAAYFASGSKARVALILSNRPDAAVLGRARGLGIESAVFDRDTFYNSDRIPELLAERGIDYVVLAGFLWLVPDNLLRAYRGRIVNVHPSLLPRHGGKGMYGDRVHRAVVEVLARYRVPVGAGDTVEDVARKVHALEYRYFPVEIEKEIDKL